MKHIKYNSTIFVMVCFLYTLLSACKYDSKFEKKKWQELNDMSYPYRNSMVQDLMKSYRLKGLTYRQLTSLIGEEEKNMTAISGDTNQIFYSVLTDYEWDIDPVHTITLVFNLNKDSIVTDYHLEEWKK